MDQVKFFKGCLPQSLLRPFLNTLPNLSIFDVFSAIYTLYIMSFHGINSATGTFNIQLFTCAKGKGNSLFSPYLTNFYKTVKALST